MKKILLLLMAVFTVLTVNSCRDENQQGKNDAVDASFSFKVERDTDFIEKAVGETNDLKFNIKPNYKFDYTPMYIKYTGDKKGVLKMDTIVLEQNKEYLVKKADNILKYTADEQGEHNLKITLRNGKNQTVTEEFKLKYGISEFDVKLEGGTGDFYQGQTISYIGKITPKNPADTKGYTIKFNTYEGTLKFNDGNVALGKEYPINDISNFTIATVLTKATEAKLTYTIKNSTVSRDLELQQKVSARTIAFDGESSISKTVLEPTQRFTLLTVVKKNPRLTGEIYYKTWLTGQNVAPDGITTTNNVYTLYALGENNQLKLEMTAVKTGDYTLNVQLKDEFGNESEVKQFQIKVDNPVKINSSSVVLLVDKHQRNPQSQFDASWISYKGAKFSINATTGAGNKISKVVVDTFYKFRDWGEQKNTYTIDYNEFPTKVEEKERVINDDKSLDKNNSRNDDVKEGRYVMYVYDTQGRYDKMEGDALILTNSK